MTLPGGTPSVSGSPFRGALQHFLHTTSPINGRAFSFVDIISFFRAPAQKETESERSFSRFPFLFYSSRFLRSFTVKTRPVIKTSSPMTENTANTVPGPRKSSDAGQPKSRSKRY